MTPRPRGWEWSTTPGAKKLIERITVNEPQRVFPEIPGKQPIYSNDAQFLRYVELLDQDWSEEFAVDIDPDTGLSGPSAITGDFHSILTVSGSFMNPMTVPLYDNSILREELNLADTFLSPRHARIWEELFDFMFKTFVPAPVSFRKAATAGLAHPTSNMAVKKDLFVRVAKNVPAIAGAIRANRLDELYDRTGFVNATVCGMRAQADTVTMEGGTARSKPRKVNDEVYARSGGRDPAGKRFDADKTVMFDGRVVPGHFAMRRRTVYASPGWLNYFVTGLLAPVRAYYLDHGAFTWKHRTQEEIKEKLKKYSNFVGVDVSQFDQSVQKWIIDWMLERWRTVYTDDAVTLIEALMYSPFVQPDPKVYSKTDVDPEPIFFGNPMDASTWNKCVGLPSGVAPNPDIGKFVNTAAMLCLIDDYSGDILEVGISTFLRGEHPTFGLLNMGDDGIVGFNDPAFSTWFTSKAADMKFYVRIAREEGVAFLGNIPYYDYEGNLEVAPDLITFARNWLAPERGLPRPNENPTGRTARTFAASIGWFARIQHYQTAPRFSQMWQIWERRHRQVFGETLESRFVYWRDHTKLPSIDTLSEADRQFLLDPSKIYYRIQESDLTPWVLDLDRASIPFEEYFPLIERYIR